ncbi:MAG: single-stranded-DNA-specific exonuclease RecJ [Crocinitomicaceae bacterium]
MMQKRWLIKSAQNSTTVEDFRSEIKTDSIVAELLLQRGIDSFERARDFFNPSLEQLHNPFALLNMEKAVSLLDQSIENQNRILLYGDYDVDGTTAVSLLYNFLKEYTDRIDYYIPDRYKEGYGLSDQGVVFAIENNYDLVIALDCGIKAVEKVSRLKEAQIDVIICDHHTPGEVIPDAIVLNPKQEKCNYPFKELSGCGVGFKLLDGWCVQKGVDKESLFSLLDLVAISIGADLVEVTGENRILAFKGLEVLNANPRSAFRKMMEMAGRSFPLTLTDVVFTIAPRINAAGRISSGMEAVELMTTASEEKISIAAEQIQAYNTERRELDEGITLEALKQIENDPNFNQKKTTVVYNADWQKGVVGIVASRLVESHYKPTIVLTETDGVYTGSARSIEGVDVYEAIDSCADLLDRYGGHKYAAGLTISKDNLHAFIERFEKFVATHTTVELFNPQLTIDIEINFDQIFKEGEDRMKIPRLKRILSRFEPHGPGNMSPVFISSNVYTTEMRVLKEKHLKLNVTQPKSDVVLPAIGFNLFEKADLVSSGIPFDLAYTIDVNKWNGKETIQLNIKDIREI